MSTTSHPYCPATAAARREHYWREGFLLPVTILDAGEQVHYRTMFEDMLAEQARKREKVRINNRHHDNADAYRLATHPKVLAVAAECLGPDLVLIATGFFYKAPDNSGEYVDWHQDTMYWGLEPPKALTVWIALYESDPENGCMRIVPRTHHRLLPHGKGRDGNLLGHNQAIDPRHFDESSAVDCVLAPGEASVHHGELVHGSNPNRSKRYRCGMTVRFTTPDVRPVTTGDHPFRDRPLLVSGEDRHGFFNYAPPPAFNA